MKIDLHIHSRDCSDGKMTLPEIFEEAHRRDIGFISITDHDNIACQEKAAELAARHQMIYLSGVELNVRFSHPDYKNGKPVSLDLLGYGFNPKDGPLTRKLNEVREYRQVRARKILENINDEFKTAGMDLFTDRDLAAIAASVDGSFGRPHIGAYMVRKKIVKDKQEAFDRFLVKCDVPKMSVSIDEASQLIRGAGGKLVLAHSNDPNGTSLVALTPSIKDQLEIINGTMRPFIDGVECWHSRHTPETTDAYQTFARSAGLIVTGGSDCHQDPIIMGSVPVPAFVYEQFDV
ncbi:MAG: PHP domain-containing protein [Deltaproteobacteria bacterium]|nr:PHP domain-containing protein [Deltaproteobacteria bacterium]